MSAHSHLESSRCALDDSIKYFADTFGASQLVFWRLVNTVRARSSLLKPFPNRGKSPLPAIANVLLACARMAKRSTWWHRPPESWKVPCGSQFVQFRSLVSHLFDAYEVPGFMTSVWLKPQVPTWEINLYLHLAAGQSVRKFSKGLVSERMTKRAAALFMQAPADLSPFAASRWSQVRSLGGDDRFARLISTRSMLSSPTTDEIFWESVLRFLIGNLPISESEIHAIIRFINQQRFQPSSIVFPYGGGPQPLQPEFSLKGRTLMSLRRHMTNWRSELQSRFQIDLSLPKEWLKSEIKPFRYVQEDSIWTIDELLTDKELRVEGGMMQHCVATYIQSCARRRTSIWSLKLQQGEQRKRMVTIEVIPTTRTIWQTQGKRNSRPAEDAMAVIQRWAFEEGLKFRSRA